MLGGVGEVDLQGLGIQGLQNVSACSFTPIKKEPLEIYRLAGGLLYTERRDLITALYTLLRAVVLDQAAEADIIPDIQKYLEDLINDGLRQRLISLIKELNVKNQLDLVDLCRLILGHCLVLSVLVVRISAATELGERDNTAKQQIAYSMLFFSYYCFCHGCFEFCT
ncbi:hypothetical protein MLD38_014825 [Melastoma candidum]|uniref:Uncharacterized protein n=1 Tax=Melastoma candidum TaxID=119954 RepID=A0ACB9RE40_9MYRT|nr:hypothetical protein MLD38_014825 [Melastoma candidum]